MLPPGLPPSHTRPNPPHIHTCPQSPPPPLAPPPCPPPRPPPCPAAGGDPEEEAEAREVCKEAEITTVLADTVEAAEVKHLDGTPSNFKRYMTNKG